MALWVWFSTGGVSGELGGWLGHLAASLLLLALSHFFLILCSSLLYKLERFKLSPAQEAAQGIPPGFL